MKSVDEMTAGQASRRGLLKAGTFAMAIGGFAGARVLTASAQDDEGTPTAADSPFESEVDVLNYALTLEHLDSTLYQQGLEEFDEQAFVDAGFQGSVRDRLAKIVENELAQVELLTTTIEQLGGTPVERGQYEFPYTDLQSFLELSATIENIGVAAYTGAAQYLIDNDDLLTAALTIHGVEARHAAYFNLLVGDSPFPAAVDAPLTPAEVLELATPFIVSADGSDDEGDDTEDGNTTDGNGTDDGDDTDDGNTTDGNGTDEGDDTADDSDTSDDDAEATPAG